MIARPFELRVIPVVGRIESRYREGEYGLALTQQPIWSSAGASHERSSQLVVRIWGIPFQSGVDRVLAALKDNGYRSSELSRARKAPFHLSEESGVRLGLLFLAVKPLRKLSRIEAISGAIWAMGPEEAYYWFSKCTDISTGRRAQKALRILLAEE